MFFSFFQRLYSLAKQIFTVYFETYLVLYLATQIFSILFYLPRFWTKIYASEISASISHTTELNRILFVVIKESKNYSGKTTNNNSNVSFQELDKSQTSL